MFCCVKKKKKKEIREFFKGKKKNFLFIVEGKERSSKWILEWFIRSYLKKDKGWFFYEIFFYSIEDCTFFRNEGVVLG